MENDFIKNLSEQYTPLFGKIAVDMGFVTEMQITEAIAEQAEDSLSNSPHRFIGKILYEHGWITNEQVDLIVNELFEQEELRRWNSLST